MAGPAGATQTGGRGRRGRCRLRGSLWVAALGLALLALAGGAPAGSALAAAPGVPGAGVATAAGAQAPAGSGAPSGAGEALPPRPPGAPPLAAPAPAYEAYPLWGYTWDGISQDVASRQVLLALNSLLVARAWWLKLAIRAAEYALYLDLAGLVLGRLGALLAGLGDRFWGGGELVTGLLALTGAWALASRLVAGPGPAWGHLGRAAAALAVAVGVVAAGPGWLAAAAGLSRSLGTAAWEVVARAAAPGTGGAAALLERAAARAWDVLVYQPWLEGEFGGPAPALRFVDARGTPGGLLLTQLPSARLATYLGLDPASRTVAFSWWGDDFLAGRVALGLGTALPGFLYGGALLGLAGALLASQLALAALLATAPLWLLLGLGPWGSGVVRWAARQGLVALVQLATLPAVLGVLLALTLWLADVAPLVGTAGVAWGLALAGAAVWRLRHVPAVALARLVAPAPGAVAGQPRGLQAPGPGAAPAPAEPGAAPAFRWHTPAAVPARPGEGEPWEMLRPTGPGGHRVGETLALPGGWPEADGWLAPAGANARSDVRAAAGTGIPSTSGNHPAEWDASPAGAGARGAADGGSEGEEGGVSGLSRASAPARPAPRWVLLPLDAQRRALARAPGIWGQGRSGAAGLPEDPPGALVARPPNLSGVEGGTGTGVPSGEG